jgi:hypothetical protein
MSDITHLIILELIAMRLGLPNSYFGRGFANRAYKNMDLDFQKYMNILESISDNTAVKKIVNIYRNSNSPNISQILELISEI